MNRKFTLLLLCCFMLSTGFAQLLTQSEVARLYPDAAKVWLSKQTHLPKHIEFTPETNLTVNEAIAYLTKQANLGSRTSFELIKSSTDQLGWTHHRYQQFIDGNAVEGGVYLFHTSNGRVASMNGEVYKIADRSVQPSISETAAIEIALAPHPDATYGWEVTHGGGKTEKLSEYPAPELVWVPRGFNYKNIEFELAYKMDIYAIEHGHHHRSWIYIDVEDGKVVAENNQICETNVPTQVSTVHAGVREVLTDQVGDSLFLLRQTAYGNGITTLNSMNSPNVNAAYNNAVDFTHEDNVWGNEIGLEDRYALDAHFAAEQYYLFLDSFFNRNSINEEGLELLMYIHHQENYANAFWNGTASFYGDGGTTGALNRPLTTIDIVAHEFTHGMTQFSAGLIYSFEPGALNESFSDIFGISTDFYIRDQDANWLIGEEATSTGNGFRSAEDPKNFGHPANFQGDNWWTNNGDSGGVHINSGVQNHWFYLLSEGGTGINDHGEAFEVVGIGWEKAVRVAYRNLTTYLTPSSHFQDAAYYAGISALDLYGPCSQEYRSTVNAWHAVGIGEPIMEESVVDFQSQRVFCNGPVNVSFFNYSLNYESVEWDFGDGSATSTAFSPSHTYMGQGTYDVTLTITTCDGTTSTLTKPAHIVIDNSDPICSALIMNTGTDTLTACSGTVLDPGGNGDYPNNTNATVVINPPTLEPLIIHFSEFNLRNSDFVRLYDGTSVNAPLIGQYNGSIGFNQTVQTSGGAVTLNFSADAEDNDPGFVMTYSTSTPSGDPEAAFTPSTVDAALNAPVLFTDNSMFPGLFEWDFGDGATSAEANPSHQYTAPGTYTVTQIITNCLGADTVSSQITVDVSGVLNVNPDSICVTINSGDQFSGSYNLANVGLGGLYYGLEESTVPWLSLDNQSGEIEPGGDININVDFDATGLVAGDYFFDVPMESGDTSQFSFTFPIKMTVLPFPQTSYNITTDDICNGTYQFTDITINDPTSWTWDFGDGNMSTDQSPVHQYMEEGVFDVSLIACNILGCDTVNQEEFIVVSYCDTLVIGDTGYSYFNNCNGLLFDQGGPDGDYNSNSDYIVTIEPTGADFVTLTFNGFQLQPFFDHLFVFDGADTLSPLINDYSGSLSPGFTVSSTGNAITIRFTSNNLAEFDGFNIEWTCNGTVLPPDDASFSFDQDMDCSNAVTFDGAPAGVFDYNWDFGDGNTITTESSTFIYNYQAAGTYTVSLEVSNAVGASTFEEVITITDIPFTLDAEISADTVDINEIFTLDAIVDITPATYTWIPEAGVTLTNASESYAYGAMGDYVIYLEVTDADGCMMYIEKPIHVTSLVDTEELSLIEKFQIVPNPSNGQFVLSLGFSATKNADIVLFNTLGQMLHRESLGKVDYVDKALNFNQLPAGIYFLSVITDQGAIGVQRLVIQR